MKKLQPNEKEIVGSWVMDGGSVVLDDNCKRINNLISKVLLKIKISPDGWNTLFRDPNDGRYWELSYPQSELHGGGPPTLTYLDFEEVEKKYEI